MHKMTREVRDLIPHLEFQQFREPDERERLVDIRDLASEQVDDDTGQFGRFKRGRRGTKRGRVGRVWVEPFDWSEQGEPMWLYPAQTPDQSALEEGLQPLLQSALTGEQRVLVRWRYGAMYTEREIGALLQISQQAVHSRIETIHRRLRDVLLSAFGPSGELTEELVS